MSIICDGFSYIQDSMYRQLRTISIDHGIGGRILSLPISFADTLIQPVKAPLMAIEFVARAALNIIGCLFFENCSIKNALACLYLASQAVGVVPVGIFTAPFNFIYQFFKSFSHPENVYSIKELIESPRSFLIDINENFNSAQVGLYDSFRPFAESHSLIGRALAVPLAFADVFLETFKTPLVAIEAVTSAVFNVLGMLFLQSCSLEQAYNSTIAALTFSTQAIVSLATCPLKLIDQAIVNLYDPIIPFVCDKIRHLRRDRLV